MEVRLAGLEGAYQQVSDRLNSIDRRLDGFEQRVDARFEAMDARFAALDAKFDRRFDGLQWRITTLTFGSWLTLMIAILLHR